MEAKQLSEALSGIDDDLLCEADNLKDNLKKRNAAVTPISLYRNIGVMAAVACAVLMLGLYAFRGAAIVPEVYSLNNEAGISSQLEEPNVQAVQFYRRGIEDKLKFEIDIDTLLGCKVWVDTGLLSRVDAQGRNISDGMKLNISGDSRIIWNIAPEEGKEYSFVIKGGLIEKTLVLRFDAEKNEWCISEK